MQSKKRGNKKVEHVIFKLDIELRYDKIVLGDESGHKRKFRYIYWISRRRRKGWKI